jgi:glycerol-3-phosphate cytidylyltransferase-like family protein
MSYHTKSVERWNEVGSDDILDERYQRLARLGGLGGIETVAKTGIISQEEHWNDMYESLLDFKQKHGHVKVAEKCNENPNLGIWVRSWRSKYREYKRTNGQKGDPERMKCLESIGLVDDITTGYEQVCENEYWYDMYNQLLEFKQKHGHVKVPRQYNENRKLGNWVNNRRSNYREYKRTNGQKGDPEQMKCLESIGLVADITTKVAKGGGC